MFEDYQSERRKKYIDFDIRSVTNSDINELVRLSLEREAGDFKEISANIESYLSNSQNSILQVAVVNNIIAGFGKARIYNGTGIEFPGWYLAGLIVAPEYRNGNIGRSLTIERLNQIRAKASEVYYFANASNLVTIELHQKLGFKLIQEPFEFPKVTFTNSHGQLYVKPFS